MEKFEEEKDKVDYDEDLFADIPLDMPADQIDDFDSRNYLADQIAPMVQEPKKKKKVVMQSELD